MKSDRAPRPDRPTLSYRDAGVDIDAGNRLVDRIKPVAKRTTRPGVMAGLGGFGALFELPLERYRQPVLVSGTDGVGTKLKLAMDWNRHDTIGIDLVAMCVNDLIVQGAEPLFFLDYFSTGHLDVDLAGRVIAGIGKGCEMAGAALVGGETAEMPGMYQEGDYDLAGFCVGIVEKAHLIDGSRVGPGDALIALASSGPHSNGYSLIRRIMDARQADPGLTIDGQSLQDVLMAPTRIYVKSVLSLLEHVPVHALAHITGGGILENLPRVLPPHCQAVVSDWQWPAIFHWLQEQGNVAREEMLRTFNCGVGMMLCVRRQDVEKALELLVKAGEQAWEIGVIQPRPAGDVPVRVGA